MQLKKSAKEDQYIVALVRAENRLLIQSTCRECGASKLLTMHSGSLRRWRASHKCGETICKPGEASINDAGSHLRRQAGPGYELGQSSAGRPRQLI